MACVQDIVRDLGSIRFTMGSVGAVRGTRRIEVKWLSRIHMCNSTYT